jgi:hypothetical protein
MRTLAIVVGVLGASAVLWAHHSMSAVYDESKQVTLRGSVTKFDWANPHVWVWVETANGNWGVEFASRTEMRRLGWTGELLHVGDEVTVTASTSRVASKRVHGKTIAVNGGGVLGKGMGRRIGTDVLVTRAAAPRWPDGHARLGPAPGSAGYWVPLAGGMFDRSAGAIAMDDDGILKNVADANRVAPFQPWAKALYLYRQKNRLKDDPMAACLPPGGPRQFQVPFGVQFLEDQDRKRVFVFSRGASHNWRNIDLDGRALPKGQDVSPTYYGYSVGRWEKDTLVVETVGLIERFWFANGGLPHTESAKLTERITRVDSETLRYEVTVDDPGAYTKPWTAQWDLKWVADDSPDEYFCDDNNLEGDK